MPKDRFSLAAWLATAVLLALCLCPRGHLPASESVSAPIPHLDKVAHLGMFAAFALLWTLASRASTGVRVARVFLLTVVLAIGTELAQGHPLIDRDPDRYDALADVVGGLLGIAAGVGWMKLRADSIET